MGAAVALEQLHCWQPWHLKAAAATAVAVARAAVVLLMPSEVDQKNLLQSREGRQMARLSAPPDAAWSRSCSRCLAHSSCITLDTALIARNLKKGMHHA